MAGRIDGAAKRVLDVAVSVILLVLTSPVFLVFAIWIPLDTAGPAFYRAERIGKGGRPFRMLKFRTMVAGADRGPLTTRREDPRVTRLGRFLRRSRLDELPQIVNVLRGEMSLVGPRPEVPRFVDLFTEEEREILRVRPGMTDWGVLYAFDLADRVDVPGFKDADDAYLHLVRPTKIRYQLAYARQHTFWIDLQIMAATALAILGTPFGWRIRGLPPLERVGAPTADALKGEAASAIGARRGGRL